MRTQSLAIFLKLQMQIQHKAMTTAGPTKVIIMIARNSLSLHTHNECNTYCMTRTQSLTIFVQLRQQIMHRIMTVAAPNIGPKMNARYSTLHTHNYVISVCLQSTSTSLTQHSTTIRTVLRFTTGFHRIRTCSK